MDRAGVTSESVTSAANRRRDEHDAGHRMRMPSSKKAVGIRPAKRQRSGARPNSSLIVHPLASRSWRSHCGLDDCLFARANDRAVRRGAPLPVRVRSPRRRACRHHRCGENTAGNRRASQRQCDGRLLPAGGLTTTAALSAIFGSRQPPPESDLKRIASASFARPQLATDALPHSASASLGLPRAPRKPRIFAGWTRPGLSSPRAEPGRRHPGRSTSTPARTRR
jgi:hypothetical protein